MAGVLAVARASGGVSKKRRFGLRAQHTQAPRPAEYLGSRSNTLCPGRGRLGAAKRRRGAQAAIDMRSGGLEPRFDQIK